MSFVTFCLLLTAIVINAGPGRGSWVAGFVAALALVVTWRDILDRTL